MGPAVSKLRSPAARTDALIVAALTIATAVLCALFDFSELLRRWTAPWERIQLDELPAIFLVLAVGLAWFAARRYGEARREVARRRTAEAQLGLALAHVRRLSQQYVAIQEQERRSIARELHDELGQYLQVIKLDAVNLRDAPTPDPARLSAQAGAIVESCNHLHAMLTGLLHRLRPVGLDELGLAAALEHCVATWRARLPGIAVQLTSSGEYGDVPEASALAAYRAVQEALTNVARHADATTVCVLLERIRDPQCQDAIHVEVGDDGRGWDMRAPAQGLGLIGMRERVEGLGGRMEVSGSPGLGARVRAWIPISTSDGDAAPWRP
jgi:signal transduction histidine kinase